MGILGIVLFLLLVYVLSILCIMGVWGKTVVEAKTIVNSFLKEVFLTETSQQKQGVQWNYGIFLGLDAAGELTSDLLEKDFQNLGKIFNDFYFCNSWVEKNHMVYSFVVDEPVMEISDEQLYKLCLKRCNSAVRRYINRKNPYYGFVRNLISIKLCDGQLIVYVAENDIGRYQNEEYTNQMENSLKHNSHTIYNTPIEEDWSE